MGREVRKVPKDWQHPKDARGRFRPLFEGCMYTEAKDDFDEELRKWNARKCDVPEPSYYDDHNFDDWHGSEPDPAWYMPDWPEKEKTHFMMYENTSEGTPISPAFKTPEELAHWLADTKASAMAGQGAPYEDWLRVCYGGFAPTAVAHTTPNGLVTIRSGVSGPSKRRVE